MKTRQFEERCSAGTIAVVAAGLILGSVVQGQEPDSVTIDVTECVDLETPEERLACFDREVEGQRRPAPAAGRPPPAPAAPAPAPLREAAPAAVPAPPVAAEPTRERRGRKEPPGPDLVAKVVELRETVPNAWSITLDNGQVWRQAPPKPYPLRPGMEVRLRPTNWGLKYRLAAAELGGFIQVERVR